MSIVLQGSTSGSVTLQEPAIAGSTVLDLPATSGTVLVSGTQNIPKAALPTGSVLQVVNATYSTQASTTSATFIDTGLTASITPTSSTSKILVIVNQNGVGKNATGTPAISLRLQRSGSTIATFAFDSLYSGTSVELRELSYSICYQDSPATTSSVTYKTIFNNSQASGTVYVQFGSAVSTITLMEIAA